MAAAAVLYLQNVNSFQMDVAILTNFQQHTHDSKHYESLPSEMQFSKIQDGSDCWAEFNQCHLAREVY